MGKEEDGGQREDDIRIRCCREVANREILTIRNVKKVYKMAVLRSVLITSFLFC